MSFGFGGNGGFGSSSGQQQQNTGFGGFGASNTGTGFGQPQNTGFGATSNNTGGSIFGSGGTGFGTNAASSFSGPKPAFGSANTSGSGIFGNTASTTGGTGFGGFGSNNTNTSSPFGSNNASTGTGLFGSTSKPTFGTGNTTGTNPFGGGTTGGSFGQNNTSTGAFGAPQSTALGATTNSSDCQGTGTTPFSAFSEKESPNSTATNVYQSISFMLPYQKFSFEELRLADYNQGRRYGNGNGQAGAFGASTGFGGFGPQNTQNTTTGFGNSGTNNLFGAQPTASASPFGASTQTTGGFGGASNMFGTPKPTTNLFGTTATSSQPAGGIFGTSNNQTGFGAQQSGGFGNNTNTGGGLFGNNPTTKPGYSFNPSGSSNNFGAAGTNSLPFGSTQQGVSAFGAQQSTPAANPFGQPNQSQPQAPFNGFGTNNANNAVKPAGLFGTTSTTGTNPFGTSQNAQPTAGNLFGTSNNTGAQSGTSLFGQKPAATNTGSNLFSGNTGSNAGSGTGLFDGFAAGNNTQTQQNQGSSIFGGSNAQKPSMFGGSGSTGTSLFNNSNNNNNQQPANTSIFGSLNNNQSTQQSGGGSSLFGGAQQQNPLQPPSSMTTSIQDRNPYGSSSIFNGLPPPPQINPGPIATPISTGRIPKKLTPLPPHKLNPLLASSRYMTPPRQGYGFSYSTYGTPSSIASNTSTSGALSRSLMGSSMMGSSLLGSGLSRSLGKSFSTSNLRRNYDSDADGILSPGAFSADSMRYSGQGSLKRLTIDRSLRTDLFNSQSLAALPNPDKADQSRQQGILKKRVSFDTNTIGGNSTRVDVEGGESGTSGHEVSNPVPTAQEQGFLRPSSRGNGESDTNKTNGVATQPEVEQVKGNELAIVHEEGSPEPPNTGNKTDQLDREPGNYYMKPSRDELRKMSKDQLRKLSGYTVGREGCGHVQFDQPVDLTTVDLDHLYDNIIIVVVRQITVYPKTSSKPPEGQGLNVPSTITLGNSWPRARDKKTPLYETSGPRFNKHVERLKRFQGTEFISYDGHTGEWIFKVPHFTTYGLDYDDESEDESRNMSSLKPTPHEPTPSMRTMRGRDTPVPTGSALGSSMISEYSSQASSAVDDTFEFKKKKKFPGAFDETLAIDADHEMHDHEDSGASFLDERSTASPMNDDGEESSGYLEDIGQDGDMKLDIHKMEMEMDMAGSFPQPSPDPDDFFNDEYGMKPRSILDMSVYENNIGFGTPGGVGFDAEQDWTQQLRQTISPRKQNREALKESQVNRIYNDTIEQEIDTSPTVPGGGAGILTSIDLMNSLFGQEKARRSGRNVKQDVNGEGFKWPYAKKSDHDNEPGDPEVNRAFHQCYKPNWGPGDTLLYATIGDTHTMQNSSDQALAFLKSTKNTLVSVGRSIQLAGLRTSEDMIPDNLWYQRTGSKVILDELASAPYAATVSNNFQDLAEGAPYVEKSAWELARILFDEYDDDISDGVPSSHRREFQDRIRKDRLSIFWEKLCHDKGSEAVSIAATAEERAIAYLSMHRLVEACDVLVEGRDFRLATLVAQIAGGQTMREDITTQINEWRRLNVLSEMTEPVRALYELLAGNTFICEGQKGPIEDRAKTFVISERFNLDWKRAFGLRLWYAILTEEPIEKAIARYTTDLKLAGLQEKAPVPSFIEDAAHSRPTPVGFAAQEDVLWGLMKLYAESKDDESRTRLNTVVSPQNLTPSRTDSRFSFQLYKALESRFHTEEDVSTADQITVDFASQLDTAGEWLWSVFVLLHTFDNDVRQKALQSILAQHAHEIGDPTDRSFRTLTDDFKMPESWIWEAKALYARAVTHDSAKEVDYLLRAKNWDEAHKTLCRIVAPQAVIEQDIDTLTQLLDNFTGKDKVPHWSLGGQIYEDYVQLMKKSISVSNKTIVIHRLLDALPALTKDRSGKLGFNEMVAVQEMSAQVGKAVLDENNQVTTTLSRIMHLPLTENVQLKHTQDLSLKYYKGIMALG